MPFSLGQSSILEVVAKSKFRGVVFDWRGTLVVTMTEREWITRSLQVAQKATSDEDVDGVLRRLNDTDRLERLWAADVDTDPAVHRAAYFDVFADAGFDPELAQALYETESDPDLNPFADDAAGVLGDIHRRGLQVTILSDIHFDIRPAFERAGLARNVDHFVLSFERRTQKPAAEMFELALSAMGLEAREVLMVGDRAIYDGAAVNVGMPTLLLPPLTATNDCRLGLVSRLVL